MPDLDTAIEEIRAVRHVINAECGGDLGRYGAYLEQLNHEFASEVAAWHRSEELAAHVQPESALVAEDPPHP